MANAAAEAGALSAAKNISVIAAHRYRAASFGGISSWRQSSCCWPETVHRPRLNASLNSRMTRGLLRAASRWTIIEMPHRAPRRALVRHSIAASIGGVTSSFEAYRAASRRQLFLTFAAGLARRGDSSAIRAWLWRGRHAVDKAAAARRAESNEDSVDSIRRRHAPAQRIRTSAKLRKQSGKHRWHRVAASANSSISMGTSWRRTA